jgi:GH15 family glucan-1,4-alpha-glucosidase
MTTPDVPVAAPALRIEDYALIGDTQSAALVGKNGSIDWLCLPRFDAPACFAALLGGAEHGRWLIAPVEPIVSIHRRYRPHTLVLETVLTTASGAVRLVDCMTPPDGSPRLVRVVEGVHGTVAMRMQLVARFDYGHVVPWVWKGDDRALHMTAGPDALVLRTPVETRGEELTTVAEFSVSTGAQVPFELIWHPSHLAPPRNEPDNPFAAVAATERWWSTWCSGCTYRGEYGEAVERSLITLKALTYAPTGGIVAAPSMSLPELIGGVRNWDYRYCWLRDATFSLYALALAGYHDEAAAWVDWLLRAIAGDPAQLQILYGLAGERRIPEVELPWLPGYEASAPVRQGNAAVHQFQLDVYGEVMDAVHQARKAGLQPREAAWALQRQLVDFVESAWQSPDEGIWEVRGPQRHFTFSKVMAWVAVDRAVKAVERFGLEGPLERWKALRQTIHDDVCERGFDAQVGTFVQSYGSKRLDASLLMMPLVGFLPVTDTRVRATVDAIERRLCPDGFVRRYDTDDGGTVDGLPRGEGAFLACTLWLADCRALLGEVDRARAIFERVLELRNDVGLLAEEYEPQSARLVGNFPQAFSHVGLINTAANLSHKEGPAQQRSKNDNGHHDDSPAASAPAKSRSR